ncbi:conjugal transfer protein MobB [Dysgonomonas sp. ZJ709]|uniref:conjugal transfer protein MobB n=1 Tax=Dysgonomonas sp. ZJ709 TaxID=2709797 RepID=UPI0013EB6ECB|nr:conjugal transfer protein MobB [Dysgonomonas sp. ZJ709]
MVAKIIYGSSIYGAVSYNQKKVDENQAVIIHSNKVINDITGQTSHNFSNSLRSFEDYLSASKSVKAPVVHFSLNPSPEDMLSDNDLAKITDDYMEKMGYKDQPYIVYKHTDIERIHVHVVSVRIKESGQKISDSLDYERSVKACRELEIKYGLKQIENKKEEESLVYLRKVDYEKGDIKRQIANTVKTLIHSYRFQTFGEFNALLSCYNIHSKQVKGEEQGNQYKGIIYCATKDNGELVGNPIKSSRISKSVGYDAIEKKMHRISEKIKKDGLNVSDSKNIIKQFMQKSPNREVFVSGLKGRNIDVIFRENEEKRIYGVTFVDHKQKMVYNGSRLGKEFSANVFNTVFNENSASARQDVKKGFEPSKDMSPIVESSFHTPASVDEIFGTFFLDNSGYYPQEEEFARKLKRKKKKGRKRNH